MLNILGFKNVLGTVEQFYPKGNKKVHLFEVHLFEYCEVLFLMLIFIQWCWIIVYITDNNVPFFKVTHFEI